MNDPGNDQLETLKTRFGAIYDRNEWGFQSGVGSRPHNNLEYAAFLQHFIHRNEVKSVVDFGCGDWQFSRFIDWSGVDYLGVDVAQVVVERNSQIYAQDHIAFRHFEAIDTLPNADLLVCKDVLQHLPNPLVQQYLDAFKTKFKFLLITNDDAPVGYLNQEIEPGGWRTLRFDRAPFSENAAIVLQWTVHAGGGWTRKATYLFYGRSVG